ncbi:FAD/NAD(P)-binding domain-containing protein [Penicillium cosmopolitanum]|uniref:FAD/NAD(P)-binding domain-containing protein n=1 Tax=Penicillium cosmopolitanum TaxID=1131564 RepID=A0A9X0B4G7_9EURO|nr:FAD/NAD(P)-binding domain-containing protein [Penicillium cosmopolitanum]KAJ5387755.1 FAD/NAD(P)-binding domain-containing protein [Penicillium cosmopolitanum]
MSSTHFKVIVVGGGPVGLTAAHALHHAGIDFVVLEARNSVVLDQGASLVLGPPSMRVMHQFGLSERLAKIGCELARNTSFTQDGNRFADSRTVPHLFKTNHGTAPVIFHRAQLVEALYDGLPSDAQSRYLLNKKIKSIEFSNAQDGVSVNCTDGSTYQGSIVVGADGVHSRTRTLMRDMAMSQDPQQVWRDSADPFPAQYRCMWSSFPRPESVEAGHATEVQSKDMSIMFLAGNERSWIFLYERFPRENSAKAAESTKAARVRYTEEDMQMFATQFSDFPVTETLKVRDVYATRLTQGMANLEEGILTRWSWRRIVLAGDACHKFTPNAGRGLNNGVQDVVALCNGLHEMLKSSQGILPNELTLCKVFDAYQKARVDPLRSDYDQSRHMSRMHAWENRLYYFLARYVMCRAWIVALMLKLTGNGAGAMRKALVLNYILADEPFQALIPWDHPLVIKETKAC